MKKNLPFPTVRRPGLTRRVLTSGAGLLLALGLMSASASAVVVGQLRCEYLKDPLGIDVAQPRLSWVLSADKSAVRGQQQSAWQVLVASSPRELAANRGDLWNSGKVMSDQSIHVRYHGRALTSGQPCYWKVRVWDERGKPSAWSAPARWTMGLLQPSDWHARWIGLDESSAGEVAVKVLGDAQWIWFPEGQPEKAAPVGTRYFRRGLTLPPDRVVRRATLAWAADNSGVFHINGRKVGVASDFHSATVVEVAGDLRAGDNQLAVAVSNAGSDPNPAGLVACLRVEFAQGEPLVVVTDSSWLSATAEAAGWQEKGFAETGWVAARQLGAPGMAPWGEISGPESRRRRRGCREFAVEKNIRQRPRCGLGLASFTQWPQNRRPRPSPALTDYTKRPATPTRGLAQLGGENTAGIILGALVLAAPRAKVPAGTVSYGHPALFQMQSNTRMELPQW